MSRNEQLVRQHKLLQILERTRIGWTTLELRDGMAQELGLPSLHLRTVKRDLEALLASGFDIEGQYLRRGKVWRLGRKSRKAHPIQASATELIALSIGRDLLYPLAGTPFWQALESFWDKLKDGLTPSVWKHYEAYRQVLYVRGMPAKSYQQQHGILSTIDRAIRERRVLAIEYQPTGREPQQREIEPYAVVFYQSSLYIVAAARELPADHADRIRHLKLDRFLRATAQSVFFHRPEDFDLEEHLGQGVGIFSGGKARDFKIRISAKGARWVVEDPWHANQRIETLSGGDLVLTVPAHHDLEIVPRVLALGSEAEVLAPASCRAAVAVIVRQLAERYAQAEP
ncbi:MAG TPA: WYL domain-containing protein [Pirellulaceae bacterium]|nr:WYL domain-containing protein [Pirellulaceae bacterium]